MVNKNSLKNIEDKLSCCPLEELMYLLPANLMPSHIKYFLLIRREILAPNNIQWVVYYESVSRHILVSKHNHSITVAVVKMLNHLQITNYINIEDKI